MPTNKPSAGDVPKYLPLIRLSGLGLEMGIAVLGGLWLGRWLDSYWNTSPWLLLTGIILGMTAATYSAWHTLKKLQQRSNKEG